MVYKVFRRPSINLDAKPKTWQDRKAWTIIEGAIVPDYGVVTETQTSGIEGYTDLRFSSGKILRLSSNDTIYCYQ